MREAPAASTGPAGAGSWGTALAIQFARGGRPVRLWGRDGAQLASMAASRCNERYLPTATFPDSLRVEPHLPLALGGARDVLIVVPSHGVPRAAHAAGAAPRPRRCSVAWATKGFEPTGPTPAAPGGARGAGSSARVAVLSGPTFAREVGAGLPTAMTIASPEAAYAGALAAELSSANFRAYTSTDIMGVEIGGAVKNALAVGAGLSDGLGFGANTRVALITRGLAEMTRLGVALGAQAGHLHGTRRARRPGADLHGRPVAQPPFRTAAGRRRQPCPGAGADRASRSRATTPRAPSARSPRRPASTCRCARWCTACCTRTCRRRRRCASS